MADYKPHQEMNFVFAKLLEDLAKTWQSRDIALVQDLVSHSEYGEAMECLIALGAGNGKGFTTAQSAVIEAMCRAFGVEMPPAKPSSSKSSTLRPIGLAS